MTDASAPSPKVLGPTLVIGGAGFIGSHTAEALLARGGEVRVLDDLSTGRATNLPLHDPNLELRTGDTLEFETVARAMEGMRWCVHLAAQPRAAHALLDPCERALSNILGFINVLEAARLHRIERLVYASTAAVYGDTGERPAAEDTPARPVGPQGMEKLVEEGYADLYRRQYRLKTLGLRYFNVYGPRQAGVIPKFLERLGVHRPAVVHSDGRQQRDFIHVEDAAQATVAALLSGHCGICNVASGQPTDLRQLVRLLGHALDVQPLTHFAPAAAGGVARSCGDTHLLRETLGFTATRSLKAGLAELASDWEARQRAARRAAAARAPASPPQPPNRPAARPAPGHGRVLS